MKKQNKKKLDEMIKKISGHKVDPQKPITNKDLRKKRD